MFLVYIIVIFCICVICEAVSILALFVVYLTQFLHEHDF